MFKLGSPTHPLEFKDALYDFFNHLEIVATN